MAMNKKLVAIPVPGAAIAVNTGEIPDHTAENIAQFTLEAVRRAFENPDVQADYQRWLAERRKQRG